MKLPPWNVMLLAVFSRLSGNSSFPTRLAAITGICKDVDPMLLSWLLTATTRHICTAQMLDRPLPDKRYKHDNRMYAVWFETNALTRLAPEWPIMTRAQCR